MNSDILERQISQEFEQDFSTVKFDDPFNYFVNNFYILCNF